VNGRTDIGKWLIEQDTDLILVRSNSGATPWVVAICADQLELVKLMLVTNKVNIHDVCGPDGSRPIHYAASMA